MSSKDAMTKMLGQFKKPHATIHSDDDSLPSPDLTEGSLGVLVGQPTLAYYFSEADVIVMVCTSPMICMDPMFPNAVSFVVEVMSRQELAPSQASKFVAGALGQFDLRSLYEEAESASPDCVGLQVEIDQRPERHGTDGNIRRGVIKIAIGAKRIEQNVKLMKLQLAAYETLNRKGTLQ